MELPVRELRSNDDARATARDRARELLPSVLLTLLSMIQAVALELLWSRLRESDHLWVGGWASVLGWMQAAAVILGLLEIWLFYLSLLLRFSWVPGVREMLLPFALGVLEFMLIDLMGPQQVGLWMICLAVVFTLAIGETHLIFRSARRDPANAHFFEGVAPATLRDFVPQAIVVAAMASLGLAVWLLRDERWLAAASLLLANSALLWQMRATSSYWTAYITTRGSR